jgi:hypothetical protein
LSEEITNLKEEMVQQNLESQNKYETAQKTYQKDFYTM